MRWFYCLLTASLTLVLSALAGCGSSEQEGLQQWITEQRNATRPKVPPLPATTQFKPAIYDQADSIEPFSSQKLTQILQSSQAAVTDALIAPELAREKEPLENSPLDVIVMVGSVVKAGQPMALVRVEKLIYQVRVGNYLGQNYGRITEVTDSGLVLREIVQDSAGKWAERTATLQLSEETKK